jgi:Na+/proline symporter
MAQPGGARFARDPIAGGESPGLARPQGMKVYGLHIVDLITLVIFQAVIVYVGFRAHTQVRTMGDFIIGRRRFGKLFMIMHAFGTGTHTDQAVIVASQTYSHGLSGIWAQWLWLFCTPFYWIIAPVFRRMRYLTTADYFRERFHGSLEVAFAGMGILLLTIDMGLMLLGQGKIIHSATHGEVSVTAAIFIMVALFAFYGVSGGLIAAIVTDFIQGFFIVVMSFMMIPIALVKVGGFTGLHEKMPTGADMFSLVAGSKYTVFYIAMISFNALVNIVAQPHTMGNCAAGRTELDGRVGFCFGTFIKRICTVWWAFTGLFAVILFPQVAEQPDLAFGTCVQHLLPLGLTGVMLASMMAAMMSSCDSLMIAMSGLFARNVYQRYLVKDRGDAHYLLVVRIVSVIVVTLGLAWAFYFNTLFEGLELFWKIGALLGIPFWLGLLWRRANRYGAWAAFLVGSVVFIGTHKGWIPLPPYTSGTLAIWPLTLGSSAAWIYVYYLGAGFISGILVTLLTPPEPAEKIRKFFTLISTPVGKEYELRAKGIEILHAGDLT